MASPYYNPYQPYYQQYQQMSPTQMSGTSQTNGIIWVQGEAGAKSYMVAPNNTVQLWDSESQTIYLKSADASGMPSMRTLDYTIRSNPSQMPQNAFSDANPNIPTREELKALEERINGLQLKIENLVQESKSVRPQNKAMTNSGGNHE